MSNMDLSRWSGEDLTPQTAPQAVIATSGGTFRLVDEGGGWVRLYTPDPLAGDILFDLSGEDDTEVSTIIDGSMRVLFHQPHGGDLVMAVRFHPDQLMLDVDEGELMAADRHRATVKTYASLESEHDAMVAEGERKAEALA